MAKQYDYESRLDELTRGIDDTFKNILEPFIYRNISDFLKRSETDVDILDAGCGCGYLTASIAEKFPNSRVAGIDISESAIVCSKSHFDLQFSQQDIANVDESRKYDIIILNMVLHNIKDLEPAIRKISIILKCGGIVLITIPHPAFWLSDKILRGKIALPEPFDYNVERFYQIPFQIKNGLQHQTKLNYYHRRLGTYIDGFSKYFEIAGFEEVDFKNGCPTMLRIVLTKRNI